MFEYCPGNSLLHRIDVRTKAVAFLMITVLAFLFRAPLVNLVVVALAYLSARSAGISTEKVAGKIKPLAVVFAAVILMTGISYPAESFTTEIARHELIAFSRYVTLTTGGLLYGLTLLLRILVMVLTSSALLYCTPIEDFLQLLQKLRMPYQLAFVLATAVRFIPTMEKTTANIIDAQRARGAPVGNGGMIDRFRSYVPVMVPMMVNAVRMSDSLAVAMLNRGYGARPRATAIRELRLTPVDIMLCALFLAITCAAGILSHLGFGQL